MRLFVKMNRKDAVLKIKRNNPATRFIGIGKSKSCASTFNFSENRRHVYVFLDRLWTETVEDGWLLGVRFGRIADFEADTIITRLCQVIDHEVVHAFEPPDDTNEHAAMRFQDTGAEVREDQAVSERESGP